MEEKIVDWKIGWLMVHFTSGNQIFTKMLNLDGLWRENEIWISFLE